MEVILQDILKPRGNAESICKTSDFFLQEVSRSLDFSNYMTDGCVLGSLLLGHRGDAGLCLHPGKSSASQGAPAAVINVPSQHRSK